MDRRSMPTRSESEANRVCKVSSGEGSATAPVEASERRFHGPLAQVLDLAGRAAAVNCSLLICGETGVGKGLLAEWIHRNSPRRDRTFVPVNCGAIPESLVDSQLFGHARGSFSGATSEHLGFVRAAEGGTLFLDEVSELPLTAQTRLLRLLQEREAQPVGYSRPVQVDVRVIAATNKDLGEALKRGTFREDLYFRLDIVRFQLKPLREMPEQVSELVAAFNEEFSRMHRQPRLTFDSASMEMLQSQPWPGNVRQLRTVIERLHVLSTDRQVTVRELRELAQLHEARPMHDLQTSLEQAKLDVVNHAMAMSDGNISRAAGVLGVHRSTIYRWLAADRCERSSA